MNVVLMMMMMLLLLIGLRLDEMQEGLGRLGGNDVEHER
jgi:hypothetical protein